MHLLKSLAIAAALSVVSVSSGFSQQPPPPYGAPMSLDAAKKVMAAAEAEAKKNNTPMAIAILDTTGSLLMFQKLDSTQTGSVEVAIAKAKTALEFRRPTKAFQDALASGGANLRVLTIPVVAIEGGLLLLDNGKVVGAIGVSGGTPDQDSQVAIAGAALAK